MSISTSLTEILQVETSSFIELSSDQLAELERHYELLVRWNRKINLTTVTELPVAATRHYGESLFLASHLTEGAVVDVGSGAGFPGIPVAVVHKGSRVDLVEAHQRKAVFLREASRGLGNVRVLDVRAESLRVEEGDRPYDWLVSRAVAPGDLVKLRLARRFAVLLGRDDASALGEAELFPLPWGDNRVLAIGNFYSSSFT